MPPVTTPAFRSYLKTLPNMKLSVDSAVTRITYEGITDFDSLRDFDKYSIESLPKACSRTIPEIIADPANNVVGEAAVPGANISTISVHRLIVASDAARYYHDIGRSMTLASMHYNNVLSDFKDDWKAYVQLRKQDTPTVPLISDKDKDKTVIKWAPLFEDVMSRTFGARGPLMYVIREVVAVPAEVDDPLDPQSYFGTSGSLIEELIARLPHTGAVFKDDNKTVFMAISKACAGTSVESTIKSFSRRRDGRGAYFALVANHAGDNKYRLIVKTRMNILTNTKWNGRTYPLEQHISNHRQACDDLTDAATHIGNQIPDQAQRVEYLLDSITSQDASLQAGIGNIRADSQGMRQNFEAAAAHILEVDPYRKNSRQNTGGGNRANISDARFTAGRGDSGVDLRWYPRKEFIKLSQDQKDELTAWQKTNAGKKAMKKKRGRKDSTNSNQKNNGGDWKKKFKKALKTPEGLAHVMSVMAKEDSDGGNYVAAVASLQAAPLPPAPTVAPTAAPATVPNVSFAAAQVSSVNSSFPNLSTKVQLQSIIKPSK